MEINKYNSKDEVTAAAGEKLHKFLGENKKTPILLLLSGGSALNILDYVSKEGTGEHVTIAMLDERFSQDKNINNFAQFQKTDFYTFALEMETNFFGSIPRDGETKEMVAARVEKNLKNWISENPKGLIISVFGMGPDGHTAGIFPFTEKEEFNKLFNSPAWTVAYDASGKHQYAERITTTLTFFKLINVGIAFVSGQEKKEKLDAVLTKQGTINPVRSQTPGVSADVLSHQTSNGVNSLPALAWHDIKDFSVFTDVK